MRILLLNDQIPPENRGGAGEVVWRMALGLRDAGHDVHVGAATKGASFNEIRNGIPTYHIHYSYPERWHGWLSVYNPQTIWALRRLYQVIQPDVVNAHNIHTGLTYYSLTLAQNMGIPTVFSSHDVMPFAYHKLSHFIDPDYCGVRSPEEYRLPRFFNIKQMRFRFNPFRNWAIRKILKNTPVRTAPSNELCRAHAANGLPPFTCVHNGIDVARFHASEDAIEQLRTRLGLIGRKVILFAGRLTAAKGTQQLLAALQQVVLDVPEATLLVLSSVPLDQQLSDSPYRELQEKHIQIGGWLAGEELAAAFHLADVVTVPSIIFDTFPTVNLEAMAAKKPVVATCYGGSHEAIVDGKTGYLIRPYNTDEFARRLVQLLRDDALRLRLGQAGHHHVQEQFTIQHQVDAMLNIYEQASQAMPR